MRLTGERPMEGATPDSLLALHDAGYREVVARLGPGVVVDLGCGVGSETERLTGPGRVVVGADYSRETARLAARTYAHTAGLEFVATDGAALGFRDRSVDYAVSSHIIEHFVNPARHVMELARVLRADGTAFVITPNAPADFENPFHVYLFEPEHLVSMLGLFFDEVTCFGLEGDEVLKADFASRRAGGERLLRLDPLALRRRIPRRAYVWAYEHLLPLAYRFLGRSSTGIGSGIDASHFTIADEVRADTPVLFAVARRPREPARPERTRVWVTVPTLDEVENIAQLVHGVRAAVPDAHILVVDDGSADGTAEKTEALGAELGGIEVLRRPHKMGLGSAYRAGHAIGIARGYDVMVQIDADLSHDPAVLPELLAAVDRGADLAIGSRYVAGGSVPNWPKRRRWLSVWGNRYAGSVLGLRVRDTTAGYRAYRASALRAMDIESTHSTGYAFQIEMTYRALHHGGRIDEVPIAFTDRVRGTSKMSGRIVAEAMTLVTLWGLRDRVLRARRTRRVTSGRRRRAR